MDAVACNVFQTDDLRKTDPSASALNIQGSNVAVGWIRGTHNAFSHLTGNIPFGRTFTGFVRLPANDLGKAMSSSVMANVRAHETHLAMTHDTYSRTNCLFLTR